MEDKELKKVNGNHWHWFSHTVLNIFYPCPKCGSRDLKTKYEVNGTWCIHCKEYIR